MGWGQEHRVSASFVGEGCFGETGTMRDTRGGCPHTDSQAWLRVVALVWGWDWTRRQTRRNNQYGAIAAGSKLGFGLGLAYRVESGFAVGRDGGGLAIRKAFQHFIFALFWCLNTE